MRVWAERRAGLVAVLAVAFALTACSSPGPQAAPAGAADTAADAGTDPGAGTGTASLDSASRSGSSRATGQASVTTAPRAATPSSRSSTRSSPAPGPASRSAGTTSRPAHSSSSSRPVVTTPAGSAPQPAFATTVLQLVNTERGKVGCHALSGNAKLGAVALAHSKDMALRHYFDHDSPDGTTPFTRMSKAGYAYSAAAENIAAGQSTPAAVMASWMNSPGHRANILDCSLTELGVGVYLAPGTPYGIYWTQDFGTPT